MHVHMSMCVTRIPSAGGFACPGDGVETARSRTTCSCWTYVREPVLKSAAVLCRGARAWPGYRAGGVGLSGCPASAASEPPSVDGRPARGAVVRRVARGATPPNGPASPGQTLAAGTSGATARDEPTTRRRPRRSRPAAPPPARRRPRPGPRGVPETVFLQKWSRVLFVLGGITGPRTLQQVFSTRASVSARATSRGLLSRLTRVCRAAMLIFAGARPTHGR